MGLGGVAGRCILSWRVALNRVTCTDGPMMNRTHQGGYIKEGIHVEGATKRPSTSPWPGGASAPTAMAQRAHGNGRGPCGPKKRPFNRKHMASKRQALPSAAQGQLDLVWGERLVMAQRRRAP